MSAYPPQPPPPPPYGPQGGQYPPQYDRRALKAQRRAMQAQARMARAQARAQMRATRRGSIVGPLLLVALGVAFLLAQTGRISWTYALGWYGRWWPLVLIGAGVIVLAEWALDQHEVSGGGVSARRTLGGGVVFLLILLVLTGLSMHGATAIYGSGFGDGSFFARHFGGWEHLGDEHDSDDSISSALNAGEGLIVRNPHGDVAVSGTSTDGQVHVSVHKQTWAWKQSDAEDKERRLEPVFSNDGTSVSLIVQTVDGGQDDLSVQMPAGTALTLEADHGDVSVKSISAAVLVTANHGDVELENISGAVSAHINDDDASVTAHNVNGTLLLEGRTGDVNLSDVGGAVTMQGDFFGTTEMDRVNGQVRFESSRTQFTAERVDGQLEIERGELQGNALMGPLTLTSTNKDVTLERVQGAVEIRNTGKGDISVTNAAPLGAIMIANEHGSVDVGIPGDAGFVLTAQAHSGEIENDFGLSPEGTGGQHTESGTVAHGGPAVSITTEGDVTVRKSSVQPLPTTPPAAPAPPSVIAPVAPKAPVAAAPKALKAPVAPKGHAVPAAPKAPAAVTF
jgi:DUF4097 and DUF4098 domain-containing protein YvlB